MSLDNPFYTPRAARCLEFFPPRDSEPEQQLTPISELRMLHSIAGHIGLVRFEQSFLDEVDRHLSGLLAVEP